MTPSLSGRKAIIDAGVFPSIIFASIPTLRTSPVSALIATTDGSFITIPLPLTYTSVFAVPRSIPRSRLMFTTSSSIDTTQIHFIMKVEKITDRGKVIEQKGDALCEQKS